MISVQSEKPILVPAIGQLSSSIGKTFRVRGVPCGWNKDDLQSFLKEKAYSKADIGSLATEVHGLTQTATLTFQDDSSQLQEILTVKTLKIPLRLLPKQPTGSSSLVFDRHFNGITTLYAPSSQDHHIDIIAISGLGGHAFGSFKERGKDHMWLRDTLPYRITGQEDNSHILRVMIHGYDSSLQDSDSFQNLEDIGTSFHSSLRSMVIAGSFRPIILVAHSLGGLIVKETLISLSKSDDEEDLKLLRAVYGIAFFGVPHDGMDIQSLISIVGNGPNRFLLESIGNHGSQILSIYQREFPKTLGGRGESKVICFYETVKSPTAKKDERGVWKMTGPAAVLVTKSSATHCRPWENVQQNICAINRTHSEMVKFGSEDSDYYTVLERIRSLVREARKADEAREALRAQRRASLPELEKKVRDCLISLAFDSMSSRSLEIESAVSGTCKWLLQHKTFKKWARFNQELLWIKGKPGSGKSTLINYALTNQKILPSARNSDLVLSFFFHARGDDLQKTPLGFFRSLSHQLLKRIPDCFAELINTFESRCNETGEHSKTWQWHPKELWLSFESSLLKILETRSVWLFVDALDECGERNAKDLVQKFELLFKKSVAPPAPPNQLRICFSCRHYPILSSPGLAEICLEKQNRADIRTYVHSEISSIRELIPDTVLDSIIERASGVFLWAQLVMNRVRKLGLDGAGPNEIKAAVDSIPEDLESIYHELIRGMGPTSIKLIQWIYFATRPLSIEELRWAMAIDAGCSSIQACLNAVDYVPDDERMRQRIVSLSQGLAEISSGSRKDVVQFIHQSVNDFFIDKGFLTLLGDSVSINTAIGMSHLLLFKTCIRYLAMEEIGKFAIHTRRSSNHFPFLDYAITSWVLHMKQSDGHNIPADEFLELLAWPSNDLVNIWANIYKTFEYSSDCPAGNTRLVHIAARYSIEGVMKVILQRSDQIKTEVNSKDDDGRTPLILSALKGHDTVVKLLLATGQVEINSRSTKYHGQTPLSLAAGGGHEAVVKLLLTTSQVKVNFTDRYGRTPLLWAVQGGHLAIVGLLLATGQVEVDPRDWNGQTPLFKAAEYGHRSIVQLLLATGQTAIDLEDYYGRSPLSQAVTNNHLDVVKLLLATGQVKVNLTDRDGWTPLSRALENGQQAMFNLLDKYSGSHP